MEFELQRRFLREAGMELISKARESFGTLIAAPSASSGRDSVTSVIRRCECDCECDCECESKATAGCGGEMQVVLAKANTQVA